MDMTVTKEEVYTHSSLETGDKSHYTRPHGEEPGLVRTQKPPHYSPGMISFQPLLTLSCTSPGHTCKCLYQNRYNRLQQPGQARIYYGEGEEKGGKGKKREAKQSTSKKPQTAFNSIIASNNTGSVILKLIYMV